MPPTAARTRTTGRPSIARPLIILCAPRSGSTLLFERLSACSPDWYTVGHESHVQFEGISALNPARRGFHSNALSASDATPEVTAELRARFLSDAPRSRWQSGACRRRCVTVAREDAEECAARSVSSLHVSRCPLSVFVARAGGVPRQPDRGLAVRQIRHLFRSARLAGTGVVVPARARLARPGRTPARGNRRGPMANHAGAPAARSGRHRAGRHPCDRSCRFSREPGEVAARDLRLCGREIRPSAARRSAVFPAHADPAGTRQMAAARGQAGTAPSRVDADCRPGARIRRGQEAAGRADWRATRNRAPARSVPSP